MNEWLKLSVKMNCLFRHPSQTQFTPKLILEKHKEIEANNGYEDIVLIAKEPQEKFPPPKVKMNMQAWKEKKSKASKDLQSKRESFLSDCERLQKKYSEFWSKNDKIFREESANLNTNPSLYFMELTSKLNEKCVFGRQITSLPVSEVKRKCWEENEMSHKVMTSILNDDKSHHRYHYGGVQGRADEKDRMAEHEYNHGCCVFFPSPLKTSSKKEVLIAEIVLISLLKSLESYRIIAGCLNNSDGGDGKITGENFQSNSYTCYEYFTETPNSKQPNAMGSLRMIKEYQKCPKNLEKDGDPTIYWFCYHCFKWILPKNMQSHTETHLRENFPCSEPTCKRMFRTAEVAEYHYKMNHIMVKCTAKHKGFFKNNMSIQTFRNYHLSSFHSFELENRPVSNNF